jgi:DNA-binding protein YbaB
VHLEVISDEEDEDDGFLVDPDPVDQEDEDGLQQHFVQAARNAQLNSEEREFTRWTEQVNRGGQ